MTAMTAMTARTSAMQAARAAERAAERERARGRAERAHDLTRRYADEIESVARAYTQEWTQEHDLIDAIMDLMEMVADDALEDGEGAS